MGHPVVDPLVSRPKLAAVNAKLTGDRLTGQWRLILFSYSLLLVLTTTLFPYRLATWASPAHLIDGRWWFDQFRFYSPVDDALAHFFLFLPFGFGYGAWWYRAGRQSWSRVIGVITGGMVFGFLLEAAQAFIPSRTPALFEGLVNGVGIVLGYTLFHHWGVLIVARVTKLLSIWSSFLTAKVMLFSFSLYLTVVAALIFALQTQIPALTRFDNWGSYPLLIGNERTGNRSWQGQINDLVILNRALSAYEAEQWWQGEFDWTDVDNQAVAAYHFRESGPYVDRTRNLSPFVWQGEAGIGLPGSSVAVNAQQWLAITDQASALNRRLSKTAQLTLITTVTPANTTQTGPARIISLSNNPWRRNFTLGQEKANLVFRLRTPLTGLNGMAPQLVANNVFADNMRRHLIITYDQTHLTLYVDGQPYPHPLNLRPGFETTLQQFFNGQISTQKKTGHLFVAYLFIFGILGLFLACLTKYWPHSHRPSNSYTFTLVIPTIILALPLLFEGAIALIYRNPVRADTLILATILTIGFTVLIRMQIHLWQKYQPDAGIDHLPR